MKTIIPVNRLVGGNCFNVSLGELKRVYDTTDSGALISVKFEQNGQAVYLPMQPVGQVYYQYKGSRQQKARQTCEGLRAQSLTRGTFYQEGLLFRLHSLN